MAPALLRRSDDWLRRFEPDVPRFAVRLLDDVREASRSSGLLEQLDESAGALGVLRAQQGHSVSSLVEDLLSLRDAVPASGPAVDRSLEIAISAYVSELTALQAVTATRDALTGLGNRVAFADALSREIASTGRASAPSLLLVDADHFKAMNDTHGHLAGDEVLVAMARLLESHVRPADVVCRLGGDEFAVILPRTAQSRGLTAARRLVAAAHEEPALRRGDVQVTLSIGVGWLAAPTDVTELVALADKGLYAVKAAGRDGAQVGM
jgi:diguanylate cyclase (GGDEF)-like protein